MSRVALVLGSAHGVFKEVQAFQDFKVPFETLVVNDMIHAYHAPIRAAVTLHPEKLPKWLRLREMNGYRPPVDIVVHSGWPEWFRATGRSQELKITPTLTTDQMLPGQTSSGSSGLFAVKVALQDWGYDKVVLCGMPMDAERDHMNKAGKPWRGAFRHREGWKESREALTNVRSMSGWTADFLGLRRKNGWHEEVPRSGIGDLPLS